MPEPNAAARSELTALVFALVTTLAVGGGAAWATFRHGAAPPQATFEGAIDLPEALFPHCLYGLDPHASGVLVRMQGRPGYRIRPAPVDARRFAGFLPGDQLLSVNGHLLGGPDEAYAARRATEGVRRCEWMVQRGEPQAKPLRLRALLHPSAPAQPRRAGVDRLWALGKLGDPYAADQAYRERAGLRAVLTRAGVLRTERVEVVDGEPVRHHPLDKLFADVLLSNAERTVLILKGPEGGRRHTVVNWVGEPVPALPAR